MVTNLTQVSINQKSENYRKVYNLIQNLPNTFSKEGVTILDTNLGYNLISDLNSGKLSDNLQDANPKFFSACLNNITDRLNELFKNNQMLISYTSKTIKQVRMVLDTEMTTEHYVKFYKSRKNVIDNLGFYMKPRDYLYGNHVINLLVKGVCNGEQNYFKNLLKYIQIKITYGKDNIELSSQFDRNGLVEDFRKMYYNVMEHQLKLAKDNLIYKFPVTNLTEKDFLSDNTLTNFNFILITPKRLSTSSNNVADALQKGDLSDLNSAQKRDLQERHTRLAELIKDLDSTPSKKSKLKNVTVTTRGVKVSNTIIVDFTGILNLKTNSYIAVVGTNSYESFLTSIITKKVFGNMVDETELKIAFKILITAYDRKRKLVV